ncbi:MAG TPA: ferritin-like domain-containing protein [Terriglobales bacterium]|nr:ferritin-like domain-containing protein [Terriglobales bacterium]
MPSFVIDVEEIRKRAAQKIEEGALTDTYEGDVEQTISILNEALATEIVCVLRYMHHYFMATGVHGMAVRDEFKEHADAEREHADKIADRIQQLGGRPDYNPGTLVQRSASQYAEGDTLADMIKEDLIAERIVIEVYQKMIRHFGDHDPTTRIMVEGILRDEEEHASDLSDLLFIIDPHSGKTEGEDPGTHPLDMHHNEQSRQQRGRQSSVQADAGRTNRQSQASGGGGQHKLQRRELDIPATPRSGGGRTEPSQPQLGGERNEEGVGNLISRDKTLMESPERGAASNRMPPLPEKRGKGISSRGDEGQSQVMKGRREQQTSGRGSASQPEHQPGATGRPMNRRGAGEGGDLDTGNAGAMSGTNRSVKLTNKKRKNRAA